MIKVSVLPRHSPLGASSRVRFFELFEGLRMRDVHLIEISPFFTEDYLRKKYSSESVSLLSILSMYIKRVRALRRSNSCDLIWIENEFFPLAPQWLERFTARAIRKPVVIDIDDDIFAHYRRYGNRFLQYYLQNRKPLKMKNVFYCVSNEHLLRVFNNKWKISAYLLPGSLDFSRYKLTSPSETGKILIANPPVLGWIGTPLTSILQLQSYIPLLLDLSKDFEIHLIGADQSTFGSLNSRIQVIQWSLESQ